MKILPPPLPAIFYLFHKTINVQCDIRLTDKNHIKGFTTLHLREKCGGPLDVIKDHT